MSKQSPQEAAVRSKVQNAPAVTARRNSNTTSSSSSNLNKSVEKPCCSEISMKDFLDFLKTAYQVNEAIEGLPVDIHEKTDIDWRKLTNNELVSELQTKDLEITSNVTSSTQERPKTLSNNKLQNQGSDKPNVQAVRGKTDAGDSTKKSGSPEKNLSKEDGVPECVSKPEQRPEKNQRQNSIEKQNSKEAQDKTRERRLSNSTIYGGRRKGSLTKKDSSLSDCSKSFDNGTTNKTAEKYLKKKLNEVLQEGILDSVLPYLLPKQQAKKNTTNNEAKRLLGHTPAEKGEKVPSQGTPQEKDRKEGRRKSVSSNEGSKNSKDVEVVIHVCDEIKNLRKDFKCSQKLLISQMGYFGEVTTGQKLEDMDISVHCDITIFEWLIRWVKKEITNEEHWPTLDSNIVVPVLMSSAFLQMDSLQEHCLEYFREHVNEIVRDSVNLTCLNDSILTRLAALFSNSEVESLRDRKDKLQSKLYCKFIMALSETKPDESRGHYSSLSSIYRCLRCNKLVLRNVSTRISCLPSSMTVDRAGAIQNMHVRDSEWSLSQYVSDLKVELKTWRKVYWRLWSDCHMLYCDICQTLYPPHQMGWCRFHTESAQFFSMENQRSMSFPMGRYPCCGERAYRFELLKNQTGCQYKDHVPVVKTEKEEAIFKMWTDHKELIRQEPPAIVFPERLTRIVSSSREEGGCKSPSKELLWWEGLELAPPKPKQGLLTKIWDNFLKKEEQKCPNSGSKSVGSHHRSPVKRHHSVQQTPSDYSSNSDSSDQDSGSSDGVNSEESCHATVRVTTKPRGQPAPCPFVQNTRNDGSRFWVPKLSTRCNQDNQREFEERAVRQIETILAKKTSGESLSSSLRSTASRTHCQSTPQGGTYVRLEAEWREAHCHSHGCPGSNSKPRVSNYLGSSTVSAVSKTKLKTQR